MKKRLLAMLCTLAMSATLLAGCGGSQEEAAETTEEAVEEEVTELKIFPMLMHRKKC